MKCCSSDDVGHAFESQPESMIEGLIADLPQQSIGAGSQRHIPDSIPREIAEKLVATDGSSFRVLPQIVNAIGANHDGKWKLHLQFRVLKGTTGKAVITPDETGGADDERSVLSQNIEPDLIDLADRGFERYSLLAQMTGMDVGRRAFNMVCLFLQGWADADELADTLARIQASQKRSKKSDDLPGSRCVHRPSRFTLRRSLALQSIRCSPISSPHQFIPPRPHIWIAKHIPHKLRRTQLD